MSQSTEQQTNKDIFEQQQLLQYYYTQFLYQSRVAQMADITNQLQCCTNNILELDDPTEYLLAKLQKIKQKSTNKIYLLSQAQNILYIKVRTKSFKKVVKEFRGALNKNKQQFQQWLQNQAQRILSIKDLIKRQLAIYNHEQTIQKIQRQISTFLFKIKQKQMNIRAIEQIVEDLQLKISMFRKDDKSTMIKPIQFKKPTMQQSNSRKQQEEDKRWIEMMKGQDYRH